MNRQLMEHIVRSGRKVGLDVWEGANRSGKPAVMADTWGDLMGACVEAAIAGPDPAAVRREVSLGRYQFKRDDLAERTTIVFY